MLDTLSAVSRQPMSALRDRWQGFQQKFVGRVEAILTEANAGLDQLIAQYTTDPGPLGAAFATLQSRFHSLGTKLDEAWETLDSEIDEVTDADDISDTDTQIIEQLWHQWSAQHANLQFDLEDKYGTFETRKQADWARGLYSLARTEIDRGAICNTCGGPLEVKTYWQASNIDCPHCSSVSGYQPGNAAGLYFQGGGAHNIAQEQALPQWSAEQRAERVFNRYRFATTADHDAYLQAAYAHHLKYYAALRDIHPGSPGALTTPEQAASAKLKHYTAFDHADEAGKRGYLAKLVEVSRASGGAGIGELLASAPVGISLNDCAFCLLEHGESRGAEVALHAQYTADGEDDPWEQWVREQLSDISAGIRTAMTS